MLTPKKSVRKFRTTKVVTRLHVNKRHEKPLKPGCYTCVVQDVKRNKKRNQLTCNIYLV